MTKCCTKKRCDNTPKCENKPNYRKMTAYFLVFNFFLILFRILLMSDAENKSIPPGFFRSTWWYFKFILFLEIQLIMVYFLYLLTIHTAQSFFNCGMSFFKWIKELFSKRTTNPIMQWLGLITTDWWLYKIYCVFAIIWYFIGLFIISFGYLFIVYLFGLNSLGYYKVGT